MKKVANFLLPSKTPNLYLLLLFLSTFSATASAHVKWFVTSEGAYKNSHYEFDIISIALICGFILYLVSCYFLHRASIKNPHISIVLRTPLKLPLIKKNIIWGILKFSIAILLIANIIQGNFIAPNFTLSNPTQSQIVLQGALLTLLILNVDLFSLVLCAFSVSMLFIYPFDSAIDYAIELFAISISLYFLHKSRISKNFSFSVVNQQLSGKGINIGLGILRFGLGLQLIILTIHDKFMHPGLALKFLEIHPNFNFVKLAGIEQFSNLHFVLAAGLAELAFGLLLTTNIAPRIALGMILFFFTLTGFTLGLEELMGHIPIVIIAGILFSMPTFEFLHAAESEHHSLATE